MVALSKQFKLLLPMVVMLASFVLLSCGKDGGSPDTDIYIPDINGVWVNAQDSNNQFSFFDAPNKAATGTFDGNEQQNGSGIGSLTGSFTHSKITFKVTYSDGVAPAATFSGTISGSTNPKMVLTSGGKSYTFVKQ
jgi:hypothetical protein